MKKRLFRKIEMLRNWAIHVYKYNVNNNKNYLVPIRMNIKAINHISRDMDKLYCEILRRVEANRNKEEIKLGSVELNEFHIVSNATGDGYGKVIYSDGKLYRAIKKESIPKFQALWRSGCLQAFMEYGYIPKLTLTDYYISDYPILVRTDKVENTTANFWTYSMVRDAMELVSTLKQVLNRNGYCLIDGHSNNIMFAENKPVWIDIGSIEPVQGFDVNCAKEIIYCCGYRLIFDVVGNSFLSKKLLYDELDNGIRIRKYKREDSSREYRTALRAFKKYHIRSGIRTRWMIHRLFDEFELSPIYIKSLFPSIGKFDSKFVVKNENLWIEMLRRNEILVDSAAELGGMFGKLVRKIKSEGICTIAKTFEYDETYADYIYNYNKEVTSILYNYLYKVHGDWKEAVSADLICANDIFNNIYSTSYWAINDVINGLYRCSKRYVLASVNISSEIRNSLFIGDVTKLFEFESTIDKRFAVVEKEEYVQNGERYILFLMKRKDE